MQLIVNKFQKNMPNENEKKNVKEKRNTRTTTYIISNVCMSKSF